MYRSTLLLTALFAQMIFAAPKPPSADDVEISMLPTNPIVFTSPITYFNNDDHPIEVGAPWFRMQLALNNHSSDTVTIVNLHVQVSTNQDGYPTTSNIDFDPSSFDFNLKCDRGVTRDITYNYFGEFAPHSDGNLRLKFEGAPLPPECAAKNPDVTIPIFYVGDLPHGALIVNNPGEAPTYIYDVRVTVEGWFGPRSAPRERFQKTIYLRTQ